MQLGIEGGMWNNTNCIINKIDPSQASGNRRRNYINKTNGTSYNLELSIDRRVDGEIWGINEAISKLSRQLMGRE